MNNQNSKDEGGRQSAVNAVVIPTEVIRDLPAGWYAIKATTWTNDQEELYINVNQRGDIRMPGSNKYSDVVLVLGNLEWEYRRVSLPKEL